MGIKSPSIALMGYEIKRGVRKKIVSDPKPASVGIAAEFDAEITNAETHRCKLFAHIANLHRQCFELSS